MNQTLTFHYLKGSSTIHYLHTDHTTTTTLSTGLGSWTAVINDAGTILDEQSYDACSVKLGFGGCSEPKGLVEQIPPEVRRREGNCRNPYTWRKTGLWQTPRYDRGFTGHEHLDGFQLINPDALHFIALVGSATANFSLHSVCENQASAGMNGRMYDPVTSHMLAPDNFVQTPDFSQNFNRYSYALNNPLIYTDPSGEIIFTALVGISMVFTGGATAFLLPYAIAADIGSVVNVASNWNNIDNFGEGLAYDGVGAISGAVSQIPGAGVPLSGFISGAGNEFLNTNILTDDVSWSDLDGNDAGRILFSGGIGAASSYYGAKWGGQFSDKAINGLNVESTFMKNAIEKTSQGFTGGYINGFFNEVMLGSGDVKTAFKSGFVQGGWGAAFGFTFSSVEYGLNRSGVEQYWTRKELSLKIKNPYDDYYEYNFKYENGTQPNSPYYQYNPRTTLYNTPGNNWQVPMRAPTPPPSNFNLWRTIYPELYYPWGR
jgi:RHS repeat-associated protein